MKQPSRSPIPASHSFGPRVAEGARRRREASPGRRPIARTHFLESLVSGLERRSLTLEAGARHVAVHLDEGRAPVAMMVCADWSKIPKRPGGWTVPHVLGRGGPSKGGSSAVSFSLGSTLPSAYRSPSGVPFTPPSVPVWFRTLSGEVTTFFENTPSPGAPRILPTLGHSSLYMVATTSDPYFLSSRRTVK